MKKFISTTLAILIFVSAILCLNISVSAVTPGPQISVQPQDVTASYPNGATFTVVPQNADDVASYQWYFTDSVGQIFKLDGISATTDTLVCPAFNKYYDGQYFFCELTGKNGGVTQSDPAYVTIDNYYENVKAVYIDNYAITRGNSIDLSTTELGSGIITYSADGKSITLDNVNIDNTQMILDHTISDSLGITLYDYETEIDDFNVNLIGNNIIKNTFYQESTNSGGITVDITFMGLHDMKAAPDVHITGSGSLTLIGGAKQFNTNGDLYIGAPIKFVANKDYFCDAINANNVTVSENTVLTFNVNGTLIYAKDSIHVKDGAIINAKTSAPFVMNDYTYKNGFLCTNDVTFNGATVKIELLADPERFIKNGTGIAGFMGINNRGKVFLKNSNLSITQTAGEVDSEYFYGGGGISCGEFEMIGSKLDINVNAKAIVDSYGLSAGKNVIISDSTLNCYEHTAGRTFGIAASGKLDITNSNVYVDCASADGEAYGIMYKTADIDLKEYGQRVESKVNKGFAMGANIGSGNEVLIFDEKYEATSLKLGEHTLFTCPEDAVLNHASMNKSNGGSYIYLETPYSSSDKSSAAIHVVIGSDIPAPIEPISPRTGNIIVYMYLALFIVFAGVFALITVCRRNNNN